ncbi:MAG: 2-C-methyl-D-erythritol 4-phosphate cytidylyltransferase [Flectobacillus sp.]|uniref:2-C-methyl-D-erythritol 4-phosphate cytidylyltransferase n=1 Tax=Flectobacillus sp. TaxID=50419 RepID=UPI003B994792
MSPNKYAIIVAGGSGSRMQSQLPKQFIELEGLPILFHTLLRFKQADPSIQLILVLPKAHQAYWQSLCQKHEAVAQQVSHWLVDGGHTRFQSSQNGLARIEGDGLVSIHDGVRPFVEATVIQNSYQTAKELGSAVASVPSKDSVRVNGVAVDRATVRLIQTPQTFQVSILKKAFETEELSTFTDDASVVEAAGFPIHLIDGSYENIKITTPEDLLFAKMLLGNRQ